MVRAAVLTEEERSWAAVPYLYAEATRARHGERIARDIARAAESGAGLLTPAQQLVAAMTHSTRGRLRRIAAPTLVVHGAEDRILPVENARRLAAAIPHAELSVWEGAAHVYPTDAPGADREIARFLRRHSPGHGRLREALARVRDRLAAGHRSGARAAP